MPATPQVDIMVWRGKNERITTQIKDLCAILCGLVLAQSYKRGQQLVAVSDAGYGSRSLQCCARFVCLPVERYKRGQQPVAVSARIGQFAGLTVFVMVRSF